ncbi:MULTISPECIES: hypothetical protein [Listeria]|uniref:hypothetical protein n=1 Tax=Listeria TaxID=1637 RepID=UPI000B592F2A|nr:MULTISPECIES: hypothetical protein [Listeria]
MGEYENLLRQYKHIPVVECELYENTGLLGAYRNGHVLLDKHQQTNSKKVVVYEEFMHHEATTGIILDENRIENKKQENYTRQLTYKHFLGWETIIYCWNMGFTYYHEVAEFLNITEEFIIEAIEFYKSKYGTMYKHKDYYIFLGSVIEIYKEDTSNQLYDAHYFSA